MCRTVVSDPFCCEWFRRTGIDIRRDGDGNILVNDIKEHLGDFGNGPVCGIRDEHDGLGAVFRRNLLGFDEDVLLEIVAGKEFVVNGVDAATCALRALDTLAVRLRLFFKFRMTEDEQFVAVDGDAQQHDREDRHDGQCFMRVLLSSDSGKRSMRTMRDGSSAIRSSNCGVSGWWCIDMSVV